MVLGRGGNPLGNVVVLCILDDPELRALEAAFGECPRYHRIEDAGLRYLEAKYAIPTREGEPDRNVLLACVNKRGNLAAAIKARQLLHRETPRLMIVCGIAGGMNPKKVNRGDVVIQNEVFYHVYSKMDERGKWVSETPAPPRIPRLDAYARQFSLRSDLFVADSNFGPDSNARLASEHNGKAPKVILGKYLVTDYTLDFKKQREKFIREHDREIVAIDTESYGVLCAADDFIRETEEPSLDVVVIRGISDFAADKGESDADHRIDWRQYAARNTACATLDFIAGITDADAFSLIGPGR